MCVQHNCSSKGLKFKFQRRHGSSAGIMWLCTLRYSIGALTLLCLMSLWIKSECQLSLLVECFLKNWANNPTVSGSNPIRGNLWTLLLEPLSRLCPRTLSVKWEITDFEIGRYWYNEHQSPSFDPSFHKSQCHWFTHWISCPGANEGLMRKTDIKG